MLVEEELPVHAESQTLYATRQLAPVVRNRIRERTCIERILSRHHPEDKGAILGGASHRSDRVKGRAHRYYSVPADTPVGRLEPDYTVHRRRDTDRSARICPDRAER